MNKNTVTIVCYGKTETMDRDEAIAFYSEGVVSCEGSEQDRYMSVLMGLQKGLTTVDDEWKWCA